VFVSVEAAAGITGTSAIDKNYTVPPGNSMRSHVLLAGIWL
jgi:hypothetical protein